MEIPSEAIQILIGAGGGGGLLYAILEYLKSRGKTRRLDEDTALSRLQDDYQRRGKEMRRAWALVAWYRNWYGSVRDALPADKRAEFPHGPPADIEHGDSD